MIMEESLLEAYGHYEIPLDIKRLLQLEEELAKEDLSLARIGLRPLTQYLNYPVTPPDLIPFADTGGDGIHFGFLTEFGHVTNLEQAPIVCVSPTNDPQIRLIARNLMEFLDLAGSVPYIENLEKWWGKRNEEERLAVEAQEEMNLPPDLREKRKLITERFQSTFHTSKINVCDHICSVLLERMRNVVLSTIDGLGIIGLEEPGLIRMRYDFHLFRKLDDVELAGMRAFLDSAGRLVKLAFIRDANLRYVVTMDYDAGMCELLMELMDELGLEMEKKRMFEL